MFTSTPSLEEDGLHSLSSKTASSAAVGTYGRFDGERSRSGGSCQDVIAHGSAERRANAVILVPTILQPLRRIRTVGQRTASLNKH